MTAGHHGDPAPSRRSAGHRRAGVVIVAAVLLAVGCSASTDTSATGAANRGSVAGGGSGPGVGWDCAGGPCDWSTDADQNARASGAPAIGAYGGSIPGVSTTTRPGATAPDRGTGADLLPSSPASVDDNADWPRYLQYRRAFAGLGIPVAEIPVDGRRVITVVDATGRPVLGAGIVVTDAAGALAGLLTTYADGRALFVPPVGTKADAVHLLEVTKNGVTVDATLPARATEAKVVIAAPPDPGPVKLDVMFLLDVTGSMDDELGRLQASIDEIAAKISRLPSPPEVRFGLTVYRDRDDLFVTRTFALTPDHAAFATALREVRVDGGGDTPEALNTGLHDALTKAGWRGGDTVKLLFVVGDAPPHLDYPDDTPYAASATTAGQQGIKIVPIGASGLADQGEYVFRQLAQATMGRFVYLTSGPTGEGPVTGRSHQISADEYSALPLDELVVKVATEELAARS